MRQEETEQRRPKLVADRAEVIPGAEPKGCHLWEHGGEVPLREIERWRNVGDRVAHARTRGEDHERKPAVARAKLRDLERPPTCDRSAVRSEDAVELVDRVTKILGHRAAAVNDGEGIADRRFLQPTDETKRIVPRGGVRVSCDERLVDPGGGGVE